MQTSAISADQLKLALVARRINRLTGKRTRWAAMSATTRVSMGCVPPGRHWVRPLPMPSMLMPMERGDLFKAIERTRCVAGTAAVRRTFGAGIRALRAENAHICVEG